MATSSFSGRNYSSAPELRVNINHNSCAGTPPPQGDGLLEAWEKLESGALRWSDFPLADKENITRHYAPKIRFLALRLKTKLPRNVELSELISAGTLGLLEALGKFQPAPACAQTGRSHVANRT